MSWKQLLQAIFTIGPILGLLSVGLIITLRSGLVGLQPGDAFKRAITNLSHLAVMLALCGVFLIALQSMVGFKLALVP